MFDLNNLIQLHLLWLFLENSSRYQLESLSFPQFNHLLRLLRLFKKLENSFSCQLESSLFLSLILRLDFWLHLQAHSLAHHLLKICSDSMLKSLLFSQSLRFSLQSLSHLLNCLLKMLEIYVENSSKDSLLLHLISRRVPISFMTHFVAHLATHQLEILVERSFEMSLFSRLDHLLELFLMIHLLSHSLFSHLVTYLQEFSLVTHFKAHLMTYLLSRVYSWRIYTSCFINSAKKNMCCKVKDNASFSSLHTRFRSLSLSHHHVL